MSPIVEKIKKIEIDISTKRGGFNLFGLFLRKDAPGKWDLVISAEWFGSDRKRDLDFIVGYLKQSLLPEELIMISRIALIRPNHPFVQTVTSLIQSEHNILEFVNCKFNDISIEQAYIVTSRK